MARDILGPRWGRYFVGPIQFAVCYGVVVASPLLGGQCMKAIYRLSNPNGAMKLYEFVAIFGCFMLILAQIPSFHSLRHINLVSVVLCLLYNACAAVGSIYIGDSSKGLFSEIFNAVTIIATTYGNGIIPEIQATIAPPVKGKMLKGLSVLCCSHSRFLYRISVLLYSTMQVQGFVMEQDLGLVQRLE